MAWLSGWSYRKEISITGQSGAGTNYQVDFDIGDSAGGDFHLEGNCTSFPQDIAVTDNDGSTPLDFWIEDITADPIKMWVEVADDLGSNQTIYVYYGKAESPTNSNGYDTFVHFASVLADYNVYGNPAQNGDWIDILGTDQWTTNYLVTKTSATRPILIEWAQKQDGTSIHGVIEWGSVRDTGYYNVNNYGSTNLFRYRYGSTILASEAQDTVEKDIKFLIKPSAGATIYRDGVQKADTSSGTDAGEPMLIETYSNGVTFSIKNLRYRKYNSPEPAFSSAGSEETPAADTFTDLLHGKIIIKDSSIILVDGLIQVKDSVTDLFDGGIKVIEKVTSLADGKLQVQDVATSLADGKLQVKDIVTGVADGKVQIQDIYTDLADGKLQVQDVDTDLADGIIQVKDSITSLADGKVQIQDTDIDLADGKVKVQDSATDLADGKIKVQDSATGLADGLLRVQDKATGLTDGKVQIQDTTTSLADGKVQVKDSVTNLIDGKVIVSTVSTATGLADGKIQIKDVATGIVDGLLKIVVAIRRISIGNLKPSFRLITKNQKPSFRLITKNQKPTYRLKTENK